MKNATQNLWAILGILPVVIISLIIIGVELREERCYGLIDAFVFVILHGGLIISLIICLIVQIIKVAKKKDIKVRILNIGLMILFSGIAFWSSRIEDDYFQEPLILKAEMTKSLSIGKVVLREKYNFTAQYGHIDWCCFKVGKYKFKNDTLILGERVSNESNSVIASKYLIQRNEYLLPIDSNFQIQDSSRWMKIIELKKEDWR